MAYNFTKSDGTPVSVPDGQIDATQFDIGLLGKNASNYGTTIAQNTVRMLENFANTSPPANPTIGQLWFDTSTDTLNVFDSSLSAKGAVMIDTSGNGDLLPYIPGTSNVGSASSQFAAMYASVFDGTATSARYADLAERYRADRVYTPGTIVMLGGDQQITLAIGQGTLSMFGVISTSPGLMLNSNAGDDSTHPYVALAGQVPVRVVGRVHKGQRLITSNVDGCAEAVNDSQLDSINYLAIIGRALENKDSVEEGKVLVAVGAK
jgi:hypothetical protein